MATYMSFIVLLSVSALTFVHGFPYSRTGMLVLPIGNNAEEPVQPMMIIPFKIGQQPMMPTMPMMPKPMMMNMMPMMNNNANSNSMMPQQRMERPEIKTDAAGRKTLEF
ncbi:uncharacterized protein LOC133171655 [Saccostrea echinata]|uniref:uncharacterized protein LOC133171655 n=1 Tax=Saccostrea echinata TaxID=191078 RepID=UPI002A81A513|nr:uncharacterized protein LOC133171655 [Saccostrea echinata]